MVLRQNPLAIGLTGKIFLGKELGEEQGTRDPRDPATKGTREQKTEGPRERETKRRCGSYGFEPWFYCAMGRGNNLHTQA